MGVPGGLLLAGGLISLEESATRALSLHGLLLFPIWILLATAAHEFGHIAAGLALRIRSPQWEIGPLHFDWQHRPPRLMLRWNAWFRGGKVTARTDDNTRLERRLLLFVAAGPAASLLLCAGLYAWAWRTATGPHPGPGLELLVAFWIASFLMLWGNLLPLRAVGLISDVSLLQILRRPSADRDHWLAQIRLLSALDRGERPAAWPASDVRLLTDDPPGSGLEGGLFLAYLSCMDAAYLGHGPLSEPSQILERWIASVRPSPGVLRYALHEAVWFSLFRLRDAGKAREWLAELTALPATPFARHLRGEAAVALLRGHPEEARAALAEYASFIDSLAHHPLAAIDRELLTEMAGHPLTDKSAGGSGTIEAQ